MQLGVNRKSNRVPHVSRFFEMWTGAGKWQERPQINHAQA
jgi:hypothetical protein